MPLEGSSVDEFDVTADEVTCRQFVELVTDRLEDALAPSTLGLVEEHLVMCDWCVTYVAQTRATIGSLRALTEQPQPPPEQLLSALRTLRESAR
jgi:predicted anti-sigma-YlaC factor YlaD